MKKHLISFLAGVLVCMTLAFSVKSDKDNSLARVPRTNGKYVFIGCEPVQDYEVLFDFKWSVFSGTLSEYQGNPITAADKVAKKKGITYDGIIIGDAKKDIAIKFK